MKKFYPDGETANQFDERAYADYGVETDYSDNPVETPQAAFDLVTKDWN